MTDWWRDLLIRFQERRFEGWLETCFVLLNSGKDDQQKFEAALKGLALAVRRGRNTKPNNWVMWVSGPDRRRYVIIGYPYTTTDIELRNSIMAQSIDEEMAKNARGAVVIGVNVNTMDYPYTVVARRVSSDLFDTLTLPSKGQ
jgi:hypothetical protein